MSTRRQFLQSLSAAGALLAVSSRAALASVPAMTREKQREMTPDRALALLKEGNARFTSGKMLERDLVAQVRSTAAGQYPFGVVLGCVDSRVPPELVFDQGIGDIFSCRIAGNFANTDIIGTLENKANEHVEDGAAVERIGSSIENPRPNVVATVVVD